MAPVENGKRGGGLVCSFSSWTWIPQKVESPVLLRTDNQWSISLSKNPEFHTKRTKRTKHIVIKWHWIREVVESSLTKKKKKKLEYISTKFDNRGRPDKIAEWPIIQMRTVQDETAVSWFPEWECSNRSNGYAKLLIMRIYHCRGSTNRIWNSHCYLSLLFVTAICHYYLTLCYLSLLFISVISNCGNWAKSW